MLIFPKLKSRSSFEIESPVSTFTLHNVCAVHQGMFGALEDIMSTPEDVMINVGKVVDKIEYCMETLVY